MAWRTFLRALWPAILAADFFTTEVWTGRGLVTYYIVFIIEWHSASGAGGRRHAIAKRGVRAASDASLTDGTGTDALMRSRWVLICDRDPKWSGAVVAFLEREGIRVIPTPPRAPTCNAYAERFVRTIKEECLECVVLVRERHLRRAIAEFLAYYPSERNHQGLDNELIQPLVRPTTAGPARRRQRLGGLLDDDYRAA